MLAARGKADCRGAPRRRVGERRRLLNQSCCFISSQFIPSNLDSDDNLISEARIPCYFCQSRQLPVFHVGSSLHGFEHISPNYGRLVILTNSVSFYGKLDSA